MERVTELDNDQILYNKAMLDLDEGESLRWSNCPGIHGDGRKNSACTFRMRLYGHARYWGHIIKTSHRGQALVITKVYAPRQLQSNMVANS